MAKIKVDAPTIEKSKPQLNLFDMEGHAPDLKIGDTVKVVITGKIKEIGERESCDDKGKIIHNISMERLTVRFDKIHEADDMDMDNYAKYRGKE